MSTGEVLYMPKGGVSSSPTSRQAVSMNGMAEPMMMDVMTVMKGLLFMYMSSLIGAHGMCTVKTPVASLLPKGSFAACSYVYDIIHRSPRQARP